VLQRLTLREIRGTAVSVPMRRPLATSAQTIRNAPLLLIDLVTEEGVVGHSYLFCYVPSAAGALLKVLEEVSTTLKGAPVAPLEIAAKLARQYKLIGVRGIVSMVIAGVDVACWDALAIAAQAPLATILGSSPKPIPTYNSNGLGLIDPAAVADEAMELVAEGFRGVKLRLGRHTLEADMAALRAVRAALPEDIALMVDFNQALTLAEARRRGCAIDEAQGVYWIEEPIRHDDYVGYAALKDELATPIQLGENFQGATAMADAIAAQAGDFMMPDLERIGGVTGWLRAAAHASAAGIEMSSHLFPEVSAHLLAATPTAHWLEYVDWANPILASPMTIGDGAAMASEVPGTGLQWNDDAVAQYRIA